MPQVDVGESRQLRHSLVDLEGTPPTHAPHPPTHPPMSTLMTLLSEDQHPPALDAVLLYWGKRETGRQRKCENSNEGSHRRQPIVLEVKVRQAGHLSHMRREIDKRIILQLKNLHGTATSARKGTAAFSLSKRLHKGNHRHRSPSIHHELLLIMTTKQSLLILCFSNLEHHTPIAVSISIYLQMI